MVSDRADPGKCRHNYHAEMIQILNLQKIQLLDKISKATWHGLSACVPDTQAAESSLDDFVFTDGFLVTTQS